MWVASSATEEGAKYYKTSILLHVLQYTCVFEKPLLFWEGSSSADPSKTCFPCARLLLPFLSLLLRTGLMFPYQSWKPFTKMWLLLEDGKAYIKLKLH